MHSTRGNVDNVIKQSFRLQRLSKTNSLHRETTDRNPSQTFKLAAINSVSRGVKFVDLEPLTGYDLKKLRKQPIQEGDSFFQAAHQNFTAIRKRYDQMKKQRVEKEEAIYRLKQDTKKYQIFENEHSGRISSGKTIVDNLEVELKDKKNLLETSIIDRKVLQHMEQRHKIDRVFYDQRKYDLDQQLKFLKKQLTIFNKEGFQIGESTDRSHKIYQKLLNQLNEENISRQQHLANLQTMINNKRNCLQTNSIREEELKQIAEIAMQDKDQNEKQWRRIYITHSFVAKMLRSKIEKQMEKFFVVESAFKQIKTATGVSDGKTLVQKYLNKQHAYGELLGKIAENQKKIQALKSQTETLMKEERQLQMEKQTIDSIKIKSIDLKNQLKYLEIYNEKKKVIEEERSKVRSWLIKSLKKMKQVLKVQTNINVEQNIQSIVNGFKAYFQLITEELAKAQKDSLSSEEKAQNLARKDVQKLTRIQYKKGRKNSMGEEIFDEDEQQTTAAISHEQAQLIETQRETIIKQNEKFMKELFKKKQQQRRILGEKMFDKKQKVKVPQVKKEVEEN